MKKRLKESDLFKAAEHIVDKLLPAAIILLLILIIIEFTVDLEHNHELEEAIKFILEDKTYIKLLTRQDKHWMSQKTNLFF